MFSISLARKAFGKDSKVTESMENGSISYHMGMQRGSDKYEEKKGSNEATKAGSASDRIGNLHRAEWADYVKRFEPRDQQLLGIATGNTDNQQAIDRSLSSVGGAFNVSRGSLDRDMSRMGLSSLPDERLQRERGSLSAQRAAEVSAVNGARIHTQDRDMKLMSGDMASGLRSSRLGGES